MQAKTALREQDSGAARYFDGDIYRQIRIAALDKATSPQEKLARKNKWLVRLSSTEKRRNVSRIESSPKIREVRDGLDALIPFTGLWTVLDVGQFPRILNIHCPEVKNPFACLSQCSNTLKEMARYLYRIKQIWSYVIGECEEYKYMLDANTVRILQGRCPFRSLKDRAYIEGMWLKGEILPVVSPPDLRKRLFERILAVKHSIPSIYTFLEGVKWLEPGSGILKNILPNKCKGSLSQAFRALHNGQTRFKEQTSAFSFRHKDLLTGSEAEWLSYRQLWLIPLRHFPTPKKDSAKWKIGNVTGKRKRSKVAQEEETIDAVEPGFRQQWLSQLVSLASVNGYRQIQYAGSADADTVKDFLLKVRPSKYYQLGGDRLLQKMRLICQLLEDIEAVKTHTGCPELTSDYDDCGSDVEDRCGRPQEHSVIKDEEKLFLNHIYSESLTLAPKKYMTSFACKRDSFHFFFGTPNQWRVSLQEYEEIPNGNLDGNLGESDDPSRKTKPSAADTEGVSESSVTNRSYGGNKTRSHPSGFVFSPSREESSMQLTDAGSVSSALVVPNAVENLEQSAEHWEQNATISVIEASRLLLNGHTNTGDQTFTVLSPTEERGFRTRHADPHDKSAVVAALRLLSSSHFMTSASGKRLKLTDPRTVVEEAYSGQLKTVLSLPRRGVQELIRQFESDLQSR